MFYSVINYPELWEHPLFDCTVKFCYIPNKIALNPHSKCKVMLLSLRCAWNFTTMNFISVRISYYYPLFTLGWDKKMELKRKNKIIFITFASDSPAQICLSVLSACTRERAWYRKGNLLNRRASTWTNPEAQKAFKLHDNTVFWDTFHGGNHGMVMGMVVALPAAILFLVSSQLKARSGNSKKVVHWWVGNLTLALS